MVYHPHLVGANAPLPAILDGVTRQYPALGISPSRLVVALPWYAYVFRCATSTIGTDCSLPAGAKDNITVWRTSSGQLGYGEVLDLHESVGAPPVTYDRTSVYKWFDFVNVSTKQRHRVSYDDVDTLLVKYKALLDAGVAGVGACAWAPECGGMQDRVPAPEKYEFSRVFFC